MENKKTIRVRLGTVVCIVIIVILILVIGGMWYYYNYIQNNNANLDNRVSNNISNSIAETGTNNQQNKVETNQNDIKDNSKNIIMYRGIVNIANAKPGLYTFDYKDEKFEDFYNTTYDIYESGKKIGQTKGTIKEEYSEMFDATRYYIDYEKDNSESEKRKIFVSCNYNVAPRKYENVNNIPAEIEKDFYDCNSLKMQSIDLDGDDKKEYIVAYSINNEPSQEYKAGIYLYDSNYKKISMIATQNGYSQYLSDFNYISYMDIDNDGNMEIIINLPVASSYFRYGIYKYENGGVSGPIDNYGIGG